MSSVNWLAPPCAGPRGSLMVRMTCTGTRITFAPWSVAWRIAALIAAGVSRPCPLNSTLYSISVAPGATSCTTSAAAVPCSRSPAPFAAVLPVMVVPVAFTWNCIDSGIAGRSPALRVLLRFRHSESITATLMPLPVMPARFARSEPMPSRPSLSRVPDGVAIAGSYTPRTNASFCRRSRLPAVASASSESKLTIAPATSTPSPARRSSVCASTSRGSNDRQSGSPDAMASAIDCARSAKRSRSASGRAAGSRTISSRSLGELADATPATPRRAAARTTRRVTRGTDMEGQRAGQRTIEGSSFARGSNVGRSAEGGGGGPLSKQGRGAGEATPGRRLARPGPATPDVFWAARARTPCNRARWCRGLANAW